MRELSLFSGAGGGLLGTKLLGWTHCGYVEYNDYCQRVIRQRIEDGILDEAPIFGDIRTFISEGYADSYQGMVDVVTAGFPCQPFSVTGKQLGEDDERNMWPQTIEVIRRVRPRYCLLENVPGLLTHKYIRQVFGDLAEMGLNAKWGSVGGNEVGGICNGQRLWIVATSSDCKLLESVDVSEFILPGTQESFRRQHTRAVSKMLQQNDYTRVKRNTDDVARGMERLKALGNGQVPAVVRTAWNILNAL